jgi:thiol:disulfide interchange protein
MSEKRRRRGRRSLETRTALPGRWPQVAILGGVILLVVAVLLLKDGPDDPPAVGEGVPQTTATLPEAAGQTQATAELGPVTGQAAATVPTPEAQGSDELPEAQLDRLVIAGKPALAFFHSNNCVQCIKMMEVVAQVYPEFEDSVALVDVNVYDKANTRLLQRAGIRAIPTQIFVDRSGQGMVIMGAMTPEEFRQQMQALAGGQ